MRKRLRNASLAVTLALTSNGAIASSQQAAPPPHGTYSGVLQLQPLGDGTMKVLHHFSYTDQEHHKLTAEPGFHTDGASIPRALWSVLGSPFTGQELPAAVIHDVGCNNHKYSWKVTHRLFYDAMIDKGVDSVRAKVLYFGV